MKRRRELFWSSASLLAALSTAPLVASQTASAIEAASDLQDALLSVIVNGSPAEEPIALLRAGGGRIYAPSSALAAWRLRPPDRPDLTRDGRALYLLNNIPGIRIAFDEGSQTLKIDAAPELFEPTRLAYARIEHDDRVVGGSGAFLNYDVTGQFADGVTSIGGAFEAGIFFAKGIGLTSFIGRSSDEGTNLVRLESGWTFDDPAGMRSMRLGDSISRGGVGGTPLRFAGIQIARNFAMQPGFVTMPLPSLRGSAAVPSIVDIYVNDALRSSRDVPPGPFEITDVPIVTGNGEVRLVVRDLLGRQTMFSQSYYAAPTLLRKGLHDYSYEAGFLRRSFGRRSNDYGALMLSGTHRYGFTDTLTGEIHAEATRKVQSAGVAGSMALPGIATLEASFAASRSDLGAGVMAGLGVERRSHGLSVGLRGEITSNEFTSVGWTPERRPAASTIQAFAGFPLAWGSLGFSYLRRDGRSEPDAEYLSANSSFRLGPLVNVTLAARKNLKGDEGLAAELFVTMPLGRQLSSSAGASLTNGRTSFNSVIQRGLPAGDGYGYRVSGSSGAIDRLDGKLTVQTSFGVYDAQLTWVDGKSGARLSTAGGLAIVDGHAFASRQLSQSFATVRVGEYQGVRIYADNQLVGRTNSRGVAVVPKLRPYERNAVRIELSDLPLDADVPTDAKAVRPYSRHGVNVEFDVKPARGGIITLLFENGSPLPAGAMVRLDGGTEEFVVAPGGDVYLMGLEHLNSARASWSGGVCGFQFEFAATGEPQRRLGNVVCRSLAQ